MEQRRGGEEDLSDGDEDLYAACLQAEAARREAETAVVVARTLWRAALTLLATATSEVPKGIVAALSLRVAEHVWITEDSAAAFPVAVGEAIESLQACYNEASYLPTAEPQHGEPEAGATERW